MNAQPQTTETGMWAPYEPPEIGEQLDTLDPVGNFVLVGITTRAGIDTPHGPRTAVDLRVQTTDKHKERLFSGFAAGIVGQAKRLAAGDLPAVCRIAPKATGRGSTRELVLVSKLAAGADLASIAKSQATPIMPIAHPDEIPY